MAGGDVFKDQGWSVYDLLEDVLVRCPRCDAPARVYQPDSAAHGSAGRRRRVWRLSCLSCGLARERPQVGVFHWGVGDPVRDQAFGLPLWLQAPCCGGEVLWAYNLEHLAILEGYVAAKIRQKYQPVGAERRGLLQKLPAWLKSAKHRDEILSTVAQLRAGLVDR